MAYALMIQPINFLTFYYLNLFFRDHFSKQIFALFIDYHFD